MGIKDFQWCGDRAPKQLKLTAKRQRCVCVDDDARRILPIKKLLGRLTGVSAIAITAFVGVGLGFSIVMPEQGDAQIVPQNNTPAANPINDAANNAPPAAFPLEDVTPNPGPPSSAVPAPGTAGSLEELFGVSAPTTPEPPENAGNGLSAQDALLELLGKQDAPIQEELVQKEPVGETQGGLVQGEVVIEAPEQQLDMPVLSLPTMPATADMPTVPETPVVPALSQPQLVVEPVADPVAAPVITPIPATEPKAWQQAPVALPKSVPKKRSKPAPKKKSVKKIAPRPVLPPASTPNNGLPSDLLEALEQPVDQQVSPAGPAPVTPIQALQQAPQPQLAIPSAASGVDSSLLPSSIAPSSQDNPLGKKVNPSSALSAKTNSTLFQVDAERMGSDATLTPLEQLLNQQRSVLNGASVQGSPEPQPPVVDIADSPAVVLETVSEGGALKGSQNLIPQIAPDYKAQANQIEVPVIDPVINPVVNSEEDAALKAAAAAELSSNATANANPGTTSTPIQIVPSSPSSIVEQRAAEPYITKPDMLQAPSQPVKQSTVIAPAQPQAANLPVNTRLQRLLFRQYHSDIPKQHDADLWRLAAALRQNPGSVVQLQGYASYSKNGSLSATEHLSRKRAMLVAQQLQALGVRPQQLQAVAMGVDFRGAVPKDRVDIVVVR